ncbi:MAG: hypothetical protein JWR69_1171 [Pedosphaera sp.]|nr:hypothetical protein [Pedosphaera sp.]
MTGKGASKADPRSGFIIQVNLTGLVIFSLALVAAAALVTYGLVSHRSQGGTGAERTLSAASPSTPGSNDDTPPQEIPPWGELKTFDVDLEQPEEYIAFEMDTNRVPKWVFDGMTPDKARSLMQSCGLASNQIERALSPEFVSVTSSNTTIKPDDELLLSLSPESRAKFYGQLAQISGNHYMQAPFFFPGQSFEGKFGNSKLDPEIVSTLRKLLYARGNDQCFSDYELLLRRVPTEPERLRLVKALSRQSAVLPRLRIRPDTDVDKVLGYWDRGLQVKNIRPLLESVKRLQHGGSVSLLYLLPPFVRERLYTFPSPSKPGDPAMDCHWSTMNFFNETPDDRFANPSYTAPYITTNYYQVAKPTLYGDIILLLDKNDNAIHSGVYLADDIIFTKNGNNYSQPWKLMRTKDLLGMYAGAAVPRMAVYRNKNR